MFNPDFLLLNLEGVLIKTADGADEVSGNVLPRDEYSDEYFDEYLHDELRSIDIFAKKEYNYEYEEGRIAAPCYNNY